MSEDRDQYEFLKEKKSVREKERKRVVPMYQEIDFRSVGSTFWRL